MRKLQQIKMPDRYGQNGCILHSSLEISLGHPKTQAQAAPMENELTCALTTSWHAGNAFSGSQRGHLGST